MITIFTTAKPFIRYEEYVSQYNAIYSWKSLCEDFEILLLGDDEGSDIACKNLKIAHIPNIDRNEYGTVLVNDLFAKAQEVATFDLMMYINSDIILIDDFVTAINILSKEQNFMAIGQRWDLDIDYHLYFTPEWRYELRDKVLREGILHAPTGIDYFIFRKNTLGEIPPFALARTAWDNYLAYIGLSKTGKLIDTTHAITAIHQNHDYGHHAKGKEWIWEGPEAQENRKIQNLQGVSVRATNYTLTKEGVVPK